MKSIIPILIASFLVPIGLTSCTKTECEYDNKYIYKPIVFDETCNCIVAGKVKYLKDCETVALVDYGTGTCDNVATKTICKNGKCETSAGAYIEDFLIDCQEDVQNGPISAAEAMLIGI